MPYAIELTDAAKSQLAEIPSKHQTQIVKALRRLAEDPKAAPNVKKLAGRAGLYRMRSGIYRAIFRLFDDRPTVLVLRIGHRRAIYRGM